MTALQAGTILSFFSPLAVGLHAIGRIVPIIAALFRCFGIWSVTTPDPRQSLRPSNPAMTMILRTVGLADAGTNLYLLTVSFTFAQSPTGTMVLLGATWLSFLAQSICAASLCKRIPNRSFSTLALFALFFLPGSLLALVIIVVIVNTAGSSFIFAILLFVGGLLTISSIALLPLQLDWIKKYLSQPQRSIGA